MVFTALASAYKPPVGLTLKTKGILSKATGYIKTDSFKNTVKKMQIDLGEIRKTKQLVEAQELGIKLSKLSEILELFPESLQNLVLI